jgi:hypothetical protein
LRPGLEPADDITGSVKAKLNHVAGGEDRRVPVVADEDQPLVKPPEVVIAPWAIQSHAPLEHRPWDVQAPRDDAF